MITQQSQYAEHSTHDAQDLGARQSTHICPAHIHLGPKNDKLLRGTLVFLRSCKVDTCQGSRTRWNQFGSICICDRPLQIRWEIFDEAVQSFADLGIMSLVDRRSVHEGHSLDQMDTVRPVSPALHYSCSLFGAMFLLTRLVWFRMYQRSQQIVTLCTVHVGLRH